jgi:hypothetical protein
VLSETESSSLQLQTIADKHTIIKGKINLKFFIAQFIL